MPHNRKKFIDKKKAVTFVLVHRGQKDPLQADENAPKHVLVEKRTGRVLPLHDAHEPSTERRREEQRKYGIYFDDDYDYLQHLRDVNTVTRPVLERFRVEEGPQPGIRLPSSVFPSDVEESVGLLNRAPPRRGPRPDWDPDVVEALDDDFDFDAEENVLEDDFVALAEGRCDEGRQESGDETGEDSAEGEGSERSFAEEEVRSRFTNYTLSSSVIPRSDGLRTLDDLFESVFESYDDDELGALDGEDVAGVLGPDVLMQLAAEERERNRLPTLREVIEEADKSIVESVEARAVPEETVTMEVDEGTPREKWDCESILSTYSNLYNRPKLISEPKKDKIVISRRSGLPVGTGPTKADVRRLDGAASTVSVASSTRPKNETPEERRARKAQVRCLRKERRMEKKANSLAFRAEEKRQELAVVNLRNNLNAIKLA